MKKSSMVLFTVAAMVLSVAACKPSGTITVTDEEFNAEVNKIVSNYEGRGEEVSEGRLAEIKQKVLDNMVERQALNKMIDKAKFKVDEEKVQAEVDGIKQRYPDEESFAAALEKENFTEQQLFDEIHEVMTIQEFLKKEVTEKIDIAKDDVQTFYDENPQYFKNEETVTASHILIKVDDSFTEGQKADAKKRIVEIKQRVKDGEDFAELAKNLSEGPSARQGGDLGSFGRGQMVKPFEDAAFALEPGEVSDIVESQFGYHIIKVFEKNPESTVALEDAREDIENYLRSQKEQEAVEEYIAKIKGYFKMDVPDIGLPVDGTEDSEG